MNDDDKEQCVNQLLHAIHRMVCRHRIMFDDDCRCYAVVDRLDAMLSDHIIDAYLHAMHKGKPHHVLSILLTADEIITRNAVEIIMDDARE